LKQNTIFDKEVNPIGHGHHINIHPLSMARIGVSIGDVIVVDMEGTTGTATFDATIKKCGTGQHILIGAKDMKEAGIESRGFARFTLWKKE